MLYQQDEVVSSRLFSFRQTSCPLFRIFVFCLFPHLAPMRSQQNLGVLAQKPSLREMSILDRGHDPFPRSVSGKMSNYLGPVLENNSCFIPRLRLPRTIKPGRPKL